MIMGMRIPTTLMSKQGMMMMMSNNNINHDYLELSLNTTSSSRSNKLYNHSRVVEVKEKEKVVVVMGATGSGKSKLSIDIATHFPNSEIINSDKIQLYQGLDILTNKISPQDQRGIPHHLLGTNDTYDHDISVSKFCHMASLAADSIVRRRRLPIIVGGSNSYIEALLDHYPMFNSKYECCLLWVDVAMPVLHWYVSERVDKMLQTGLLEEVRGLFDPNNADYSRGIRKAIGVRELDPYLRGPNKNYKLLQQGISEIKENTCKLACNQFNKIQRLRNVKGWNIHRLDATEAFHFEEAWGKHVSGPSIKILNKFLTTPTHGHHQQQCRPIILDPTDFITMSFAAATATATAPP